MHVIMGKSRGSDGGEECFAFGFMKNRESHVVIIQTMYSSCFLIHSHRCYM